MYRAILFSPDGEYVTDFRNSESIDDVWDKISNMGSRWYFFPIGFVGTDKRILDTPEGLEILKRKSIKKFQSYLKKEWETRSYEICKEIEWGFPLETIFTEESIKFHFKIKN